MRIQDCKHVIYQGDFIKRIYNANQIIFEESVPSATGYLNERAFQITEGNKKSIKELCNSNNITQIIFTNNSGYYSVPGYELSWSDSYVSPNIEQYNTEPIVCHLKMTNSGIILFCVGNINSIVFPCLLDNFFSELTTITNIECKNINSFIDDVRSNVSLKRFCYKCNNLTTLRLGNLTCLGNGHLESLERAFEDCIKLKSINLNNFNFDSLDNENGLTRSFYNCLALEDIEENDFWEDIFSLDERIFYETFSYCNCEKVDIDFSGNKNPNNLYSTFKGAILHDVNFSNKSNLDDYVLRYEDLFRGATITGTLNLSNNLIKIYQSSDDTYYSIMKAFFKNAKCFNVLINNCYFYSSDSLSLVLKNFVFSLKFNNSVSFQNMWEKTSIISNNLFNYFIDKITGESPQLKELDFSNNVFDKNYIFDTGSTIPIRDASGNPTTRTKETCTNLHNLQVLKLNDTNITRLKHMGYSWYQENQDGTIHVEYQNYSPIKTLYLSNVNNVDNDFISFYFDGMSGLKELYIQNRKIQNFMTKLWYNRDGGQWERTYVNSAISFNYRFEYLNIAGSQIKLTQDYFDIPLVQKIEGNSNTKFVGRGPFHFFDSHYEGSPKPDRRYITYPDLFNFLPSANFDDAEITSINFQYLLMPSIDLSNITNYQYLTHIGFDTCPKLLEVLFNNNIDTSNITNMSYMFNRCYALASLDVSNFNTSNVTNMEYMFQYSEDLPTLNVSNFDTSNVENMSHMFYNCNSLTTLNVSNFNTSNVENMSYMFYNCNSLTTLNVSNFDISKVIKPKDYLKDLPDDYYNIAFGYAWVGVLPTTFLDYMFAECTNLTSINLFNINVPNNKILSLRAIFGNCTNLTTININYLKYFCNFDGNDYYERGIVPHQSTTPIMRKIVLFSRIYASGMFSNCENLQTIIVNHIDSPQINIVNFDSSGEYYASTLTDKNIFPNCESLQGGNGTQWTSDTKDYTYFQADLPNQVGLLTYQATQGGN